MRHSRSTLAAALVVGVALLTACGSPSDPATSATDGATAGSTAVSMNGAGLEGVSATGPVDLKTAPKVTLGKTPVSTTEISRKVLTPGTGPAATKEDTVQVRLQIFHGTSGKLLDDGFAKDRKPESYRLGRQDLIAGLTEGLLGAQAKGRMVFTIPPSKGFGEAGNEQLGITGKDTIVVVADVGDIHAGLKQVDGEQKPTPADLPAVTFPNGPQKEPKVTVPKSAAPTATKSFVLVEGDGEPVEKGQTVVAQYHGVLWKDGSVFDSSWQRGFAADFPIGVGAVIPGWDSQLVGKKVGSRVLLVIPPKDGYGEAGMAPKISGTDTLVFVVDILDAY